MDDNRRRRAASTESSPERRASKKRSKNRENRHPPEDPEEQEAQVRDDDLMYRYFDLFEDFVLVETNTQPEAVNPEEPVEVGNGSQDGNSDESLVGFRTPQTPRSSQNSSPNSENVGGGGVEEQLVAEAQEPNDEQMDESDVTSGEEGNLNGFFTPRSADSSASSGDVDGDFAAEEEAIIDDQPAREAIVVEAREPIMQNATVRTGGAAPMNNALQQQAQAQPQDPAQLQVPAQPEALLRRQLTSVSRRQRHIEPPSIEGYVHKDTLLQGVGSALIDLGRIVINTSSPSNRESATMTFVMCDMLLQDGPQRRMTRQERNSALRNHAQEVITTAIKFLGVGAGANDVVVDAVYRMPARGTSLSMAEFALPPVCQAELLVLLEAGKGTLDDFNALNAPPTAMYLVNENRCSIVQEHFMAQAFRLIPPADSVATRDGDSITYNIGEELITTSFRQLAGDRTRSDTVLATFNSMSRRFFRNYCARP